MNEYVFIGDLIDENYEFTLDEICCACSRQTTWIIELIDEGVLDPIGNDQNQWRFSLYHLKRAQIALRLERDLGINLPGIALALDLLEEIQRLKA